MALPQNSDIQLTQLSQPPPSLPLYTADTYGLMKGFGQVSSWPQTPLIAVASSSSGSMAARPWSEAGPPAAASIAAQSWQCGRPGGMNSVSDDGSSVESDPAAVVEDALLGELFFQQLQVDQQARVALAQCLARPVFLSALLCVGASASDQPCTNIAWLSSSRVVTMHYSMPHPFPANQY